MSTAFRSTRSTGTSIGSLVGNLERRSVLLVAVAVVAAYALAAAAVGSTKPSTIALRATAVGKVLVAANGRTLYLFTADKGKTSTCYGQCASFWPPLIATKPSAGRGLKASLLGTTKRKDGRRQVTYGGHRLYFFVKDKKAGDVKGQAFVHFGGAWWVVAISTARRRAPGQHEKRDDAVTERAEVDVVQPGPKASVQREPGRKNLQQLHCADVTDRRPHKEGSAYPSPLGSGRNRIA